MTAPDPVTPLPPEWAKPLLDSIAVMEHIAGTKLVTHTLSGAQWLAIRKGLLASRVPAAVGGPTREKIVAPQRLSEEGRVEWEARVERAMIYVANGSEGADADAFDFAEALLDAVRIEILAPTDRTEWTRGFDAGHEAGYRLAIEHPAAPTHGGAEDALLEAEQALDRLHRVASTSVRVGEASEALVEDYHTVRKAMLVGEGCSFCDRFGAPKGRIGKRPVHILTEGAAICTAATQEPSADSKRLDWLEAEMGVTSTAGGPPFTWFFHTPADIHLREAIDAEMNRVPPSATPTGREP